MRKTDNSVKKAKGTFRKQRENKFFEPAGLDDLIAPDELSQLAKIEWDYVAPSLPSLSPLDKKMLMAYCEETAKYWKYQRDMNGKEAVLELLSKDGIVVNYRTNPLIDLSDRALKNAHAIGIHFGLTPLSRSKITVSDKPKEQTPESRAEDTLNALLKGKQLMKVG
jgi:P27 family predicted phage terminase small subunit